MGGATRRKPCFSAPSDKVPRKALLAATPPAITSALSAVPGNRAEKRKNSDKMERLEQLYLELFPKQSLQERHDNFIPYYEEYGEKWLQKLLYDLDPLDFRFALLRF